MCNFIPVRNFLIALGIFCGFAASSAVFAMLWQKSGSWPPLVTISYSAAATWALAALITLAFTFGALAAFCTCAAGVPACASACSSIRTTLTSLTVALLALFAVCTVAAGDWLETEWYLWIGATLAASAVTVLMATAAIYGSRLGSCGAP